jgi:hypothetical protein
MAKQITAADLKQMITNEDTPRMKCLKKAQQDHFNCLAGAGNDAAKRSACDKALSNAVNACPPP